MALVRWQGTVADQNGNIQSGASVEVRDPSGALATIYSDRSLTAKANPFTTDSEGYGFYYAEQGRYTVNATAGAFSISWQDVELASATSIRSLDLTQTGDLIAGTVWGIDATAARSRPLPLSPEDGEEVGFYVQQGGDIRNNNTTIEVTAPDQIAGNGAGVNFTINQFFTGTLKYNAATNDWQLIADSQQTVGGEVITEAIRVNSPSDATGVLNAINGIWQKITLTANRDFTFDLKAGEYMFITVTAGAFSLSYTNVTEWVGGAEPASIGTEAAFLFWSDDGVAVTGQYIGDIS